MCQFQSSMFHPLTASIGRPEFQGHPNPPRRKDTTPTLDKTFMFLITYWDFRQREKHRRLFKKVFPTLLNSDYMSNTFLQLENVCSLLPQYSDHVCHSYGPNLFHTDRTKRVKDARSEAQKEIEEYRKQKDEEFKKYEKEVLSNSPLREIQELI